jgi:hypothetical protein
MAVTTSLPVEAALAYAARGWHVYPCIPRSRTPFRGSHGYKDATTDPALIKKWWGDCPQATVSIATGASGLLVVDVDGDRGIRSLKALMAHHGELPDTAFVKSGGDGHHLYFRTDEVCSSRHIAENLESKGHAIVAPPSLHWKTGRPYQWLVEEPIADAPGWLTELCRRAVTDIVGEFAQTFELTEYGVAALKSADRNIREAPNGMQRHTLNREAHGIARAVAAGLIPRREAYDVLIEAGNGMVSYNVWNRWTPASVKNVVDLGWRDGIKKPRESVEDLDDRAEAVMREYLP